MKISRLYEELYTTPFHRIATVPSNSRMSAYMFNLDNTKNLTTWNDQYKGERRAIVPQCVSTKDKTSCVTLQKAIEKAGSSMFDTNTQ